MMPLMLAIWRAAVTQREPSPAQARPGQHGVEWEWEWKPKQKQKQSRERERRRWWWCANGRAHAGKRSNKCTRGRKMTTTFNWFQCMCEQSARAYYYYCCYSSSSHWLQTQIDKATVTGESSCSCGCSLLPPTQQRAIEINITTDRQKKKRRKAAGPANCATAAAALFSLYLSQTPV